MPIFNLPARYGVLCGFNDFFALKDFTDVRREQITHTVANAVSSWHNRHL